MTGLGGAGCQDMRKCCRPTSPTCQCHHVARYRAVLFDWMLTLAEYPDDREHVRRAHLAIERDLELAMLDAIVGRLETAARDADVIAAMAHEDCSTELHRLANLLLFERAEIDHDLAVAMYALLGDPTFHPVYAETPTVLRDLADHGVRVAVVSDIHVDLRAHAVIHGIDHLIDSWILSYQHGIQKPDRALFQLALDALGVRAADTLMVGDRASHDGAAATLGIDTLILPARRDAIHRRSGRLDAVMLMMG